MAERASSLNAVVKYKDTPIGKIPVDWQVSPLGKITNFEYGESLPEEKRKKGCIGVYGSNGLVGYHNESLAKGPGIIIGRKGTVGAVTWVDNDFWPIDTTYYITREETQQDLKWLFYLLSFLHLEKLNAATGVPGLNRDEAYSEVIPCPSFHDQKRIAEILATVDEAIEKTAQIIEKTKEVKKGLMQKLLTRGIGHKKFKKTEIGEIPERWDLKPLIEVMVLQRGFDLPFQHRSEGRYPILASNGVIGYHSEFKVKGPGIVTGRSGTLGKVHYVESDYWPLNTTLFTKDFYDNHPKFLYYFLQKLEVDKYGTGTGVPTLNRNIVHKVRVALPPVSEQVKIASILSEVDTRIEKEIDYKSDLEEMKRSLMQKLLTGKIRVTL